jgi:hypothetical protein
LKYWRGFLVAGIIAACTWGLTTFAQTHTTLIDMIFPYVSRMITGGTAQWSASVSFCMWQALLIFAVLGCCSLVALAIVLRWNVLQISGWITAVISLIVFLNTGIFGMNNYAGPLADDINLNVSSYEISELEDAAKYYLEEAIKARDQIPTDAYVGAEVVFPDFDTLAQQAEDGFHSLVYDEKLSVFAGSMVPVKKLGWKGYYTGNSTTGVTVHLTGEAAVNPDVPGILLPFAICHEMSHRMSIASDRDANFSAFLACTHNQDPFFAYSGYVNAYRYCLKALKSFGSESATAAVARLEALENGRFAQEISTIDSFYKNSEDATEFRGNVQLLVSWYIQEVYLPDHMDEEVPSFDPLDETQVDLNGFVNGPAA